MSTTPSDTLTAALALHAAGCSVVPVRVDGTKAPAANWKQYTDQRADEPTIRGWFTGGHPGVGIVTGAVSGNVEMFEFEGRAQDEGVVAEFVEIVRGSGLAETWNRIVAGWAEQSPSGGLHVLFRVDGAPVVRNTKLARRPATEAELAENPRERVQVLAETRGEGGFTVTAPSHGPVHATGQPWQLLSGGPATMAVISAGEYDALHTIARMVDQMPVTDGPDAQVTPVSEPLDEAAAFLFGGGGSPQHTDSGGLKPGDDYEQRTSWDEILKPAGWTLLSVHGGTHYWQRPGKTDPGPSATTGRAADRDRLYVFTTSTEFLAEVPYTKFGAYALLHHGGDHHAAASSLRRQGYGEPTPEPVRHLSSVPAPRPATDGTAALNVIQHPAAQPGPGTYTRTDDGNALRLVDQHEHQIRYVPQRGKWLTWEGHRWAWDEAGQVKEHARAIARALPNGEGEAKHRAASLSARGLGSMVSVAQTDPRIVAPAATLDAHRTLLNTPAGPVDLRTGQLSAPDPAQMHTRSSTVAPEPDMPTPRWNTFLNQTFGGDAELLQYVQRMAGYSASGSLKWHILPFLHGAGGNGKGVFLNVLRILLGDYAATAPNAFLMAGGQRHETEIARLHGLRLVITSEVNQEAKFDEAKVKELTGGDALTARFMRQDHFTFEPTHKLWLMGNHQPKVSAGGKSFWRRLRLVPFAHTPTTVVEDLDLLLTSEEGPGILAWIVAGAVAVFRDGLADPESVKAATALYAAEEDALARFLEEACHVGGGGQVRTATEAFRTAYERWCRIEGEDPLPSRQLGRELKDRFAVVRKPSNGSYFYTNVGLVSTEEHWSDR